jgi:hypothetical protein
MRWGYRKLQLDKSQLRPLKDGKPAISDWRAVHWSERSKRWSFPQGLRPRDPRPLLAWQLPGR